MFEADSRQKLTERVQASASKYGFEMELISHSISGRSTEDACRALQIDSSFIIKALLLKNSAGDNFAVICRGCDRLNFEKLGALGLQWENLKLCKAAEVVGELGYQVGGVPVLVFAELNIPTVVDLAVLKGEWVVGSGGTPFHGMKMDPKQLVDKLKFSVGDIVV